MDAPQSERFKKLREGKNYRPPRKTICEKIKEKIQERIEPLGEGKDELTDRMIKRTFDLFK